MKTWSSVRIAIALVGFFLVVPLLCFVLFTAITFNRMHGELPSDQQAIAMYDDVILFLDSASQSHDQKHVLPESIQKHNPLFYKINAQGMIIIFGQKYVENYGLYYTSSEGTSIQFCQEKIAPGIYRYYDPG